VARKTKAETRAEDAERLRQHMRHGNPATGTLVGAQAGSRAGDGGPLGDPVGLRQVTGGWAVTHPGAVAEKEGVFVTAVRFSAVIPVPDPTDKEPDRVRMETVEAETPLPEPVFLPWGAPIHLVVPDRPGLSAGEPVAPAEEALELERDPADPAWNVPAETTVQG
jgi:hypothetical protein